MDMETLTTNAAVRVEPGLPPEGVEAGARQLGDSASRPLRGQHPLPTEKHCHHHLRSENSNSLAKTIVSDNNKENSDGNLQKELNESEKRKINKNSSCLNSVQMSEYHFGK